MSTMLTMPTMRVERHTWGTLSTPMHGSPLPYLGTPDLQHESEGLPQASSPYYNLCHAWGRLAVGEKGQ